MLDVRAMVELRILPTPAENIMRTYGPSPPCQILYVNIQGAQMICAMFPKRETNKKQVTCFVFICFTFWKHSTDHFTLKNVFYVSAFEAHS